MDNSELFCPPVEPVHPSPEEEAPVLPPPVVEHAEEAESQEENWSEVTPLLPPKEEEPAKPLLALPAPEDVIEVEIEELPESVPSDPEPTPELIVGGTKTIKCMDGSEFTCSEGT